MSRCVALEVVDSIIACVTLRLTMYDVDGGTRPGSGCGVRAGWRWGCMVIRPSFAEPEGDDLTDLDFAGVGRKWFNKQHLPAKVVNMDVQLSPFSHCKLMHVIKWKSGLVFSRAISMAVKILSDVVFENSTQRLESNNLTSWFATPAIEP